MTDPKAYGCILRWDPAAIPDTLYPEAYSVGVQSAFTIATKVTVVGGAKQALLSLGTAAGIRLEVGLTALSEPYVEGDALVLLGDPVADGEHDIAWVFESDGNVICVVDSVVVGQSASAATSSFDRIVVGGRSSGGNAWAGSVEELYVYSLDDVASVTGMLGSDGIVTPLPGRVPPDSFDILVYEFGDPGPVFANSGTAVGADLSLVGVAFPNELDPWGGTMSVGMGRPNTRDTIYGANSVQPQPPLTVSFWLYHYTRATNFTQHFFQKQHTTGVWSGVYSSIVFQNRVYAGQNNGEWEVYLHNVAGGVYAFNSSNQIPLNEWIHLGFTYDGSTFTIYKNGVIQHQGAASGLIGYNSGPWFVGAIPSGSGAPEEMMGRICDARVAETIRPLSWFQQVYASKI